METWSIEKEKKHSRQKSQKSEMENKNYRAKNTILYDIMPIYYLGKICGSFPVKFVLKKTGRYVGQVDFLQVAYGIILALALMGGQCYGLYRDVRDGWQSSTRLSSKSSIFVMCSDVFAVMSVALVVILGSSNRWWHLQRALNKLVDVDTKLGTISITNPRKLSIIIISCTLIYLIVISTMDFFSWSFSATDVDSELIGDKGPLNYTPMYFMYLVIVVFELQYAVVLFSVGERFSKLNRAIENLVIKVHGGINLFRKDLPLDQKVTRQYSKLRIMQSVLSDLDEQNRCDNDEASSAVADEIDQLITIHSILCDSVDCVNKAYGIAILMGTISCLVHLIITLYFLYNHIYSRNPNSWPLLFLQFFWILFHIYRMQLFIQPCHSVVIKAKRTGALVNQALANDWSVEVKMLLNIFSIQLLQRPIEFTACGLFYLNRGLMTSIAGSVTTYLVILVQFQTADDTKGTKNLLENASELLKNVSSFKNIFQIK